MKSVALGTISGIAVLAIAAVPASAGTTNHPQARTAPATSGHATWHSGLQRPAAHRSTARSVAPTPASKAGPVSTKRLIIRAVTKSSLLGSIRPDQVTVSRVRVSRVDPSWAAAKVTPKNPNLTDPADVVLHKIGRTWRAVDLGTAEVGCALVRQRVVNSLGLTCG